MSEKQDSGPSLWKQLGTRPRTQQGPAPFVPKLDIFATPQPSRKLPAAPPVERPTAIVRAPQTSPSAADTHAWTHGQQRALAELRRWSWGAGGPVFGLFGYAGTGKSTVIQSWVREQRARTVLLCAPTHKAASVQAAESEECARLRAVIKDISEMCSAHVRSLMFTKREAARQERRADAWQIAAQDALSQLEEIRAIRNGDELCTKG